MLTSEWIHNMYKYRYILYIEKITTVMETINCINPAHPDRLSRAL